jgi:hypothetical protein
MKIVLIVESEEPLMRLMFWALADAGYRVEKATSIADAVDHAADIHPEVIVFNTGLAVDEKRHAIGQFRVLVPGVKVVDFAMPEARPNEDSRADGYLRTPLTPWKVRDTVADVLDDRISVFRGQRG